MKKKLTVLLAVAVMSMSSVYAAEAQGPISRWLDNLTGSVAQKEQSAYQKQQAKQQKLAEKKKKQNKNSLKDRKKLKNSRKKLRKREIC